MVATLKDLQVSSLKDAQVSSPGDGVAVVTCTGEHDLATSSALSELLDVLVRAEDLVVVDFSEVEFVDSSILHALVVAYRLSRERETSFRLQLGTEAIVERAFEISGLPEQIPYARSRREALNGSAPVRAVSSEGSDG